MNEKALVNRAKLIEKAFELSLSKVPRHSCHTQPFFGGGDFYSESVIQTIDRSSRTTRAAQAYDRRRRHRAGASVAGSSLFSVEHQGRLNSARTTSLFLIIVGGDGELVDRLRKSWRTLLYGVLLNAVSALPLGTIPTLRQQRNWVGEVRKMAIFADVQYYLC